MRSCQISEPGHIKIIDQPKPAPGPGEVLVRITAAGICGTDIHIYEGHYGSLPITPGHDVAGIIEAVGDNVNAERIGSRITIDPAACCVRAAIPGELCPACRRGATNLCSEGTYMGMSAPGAMAEFVALPAARAIQLPDNIDDETATALEPVVVGLHLKEQIEDRPGRALVIGGGSIGIIAALLLQLDGREVLLSEPLENRRQLAGDLGVKKVIAPQALDANLEINVIVETSGHPSSIDTIIDTAPAGSTIVLVGGDTTVPAMVILTRELEVRAAKGGRGLYPEAVAQVASGKLSPGSLISHRFAVKDIARAFDISSQRQDTVSRSVLDMTAW